MTDLQLAETLSLGEDTGQGNLLGVQPYLTTTDYASGEAFYDCLEAYLQAARQQGWLGEQTVVVFPENIGTWLVATGEGQAVLQASSLTAAMRPLVLRHLLSFVSGLLRAPEKERAIASLFRLKARQMAQLYQETFGRLARQHTVTVVAGSIYLPLPFVHDGQLQVSSMARRRGPESGPVKPPALYNTSVVYCPDGTACNEPVRKCYPIKAELGFVRPSPVAEVPVFETPIGKLGVLVCADAWYPQAYHQLESLEAEWIAVPSLAAGAGIWEQPWGGYNGTEPPPDVDEADVGQLTEGQAWQKYALAGRIASVTARGGVNVFLHGELWDLGSDNGNSIAIREGEMVEAVENGPALLNVWA